MQARYRRDTGEIQARCRRDVALALTLAMTQALALALAAHLVEHGEEEAARLARARLRARHQVAPRHAHRDRVALHRRRLDELRGVDVRLQPRVQRDVGKFLEGLHRSGAVTQRKCLCAPSRCQSSEANGESVPLFYLMVASR